MSALLLEEEYEDMHITVKVPRRLPIEIVESLEEGMSKAVDILAKGTGLSSTRPYRVAS